MLQLALLSTLAFTSNVRLLTAAEDAAAPAQADAADAPTAERGPPDAPKVADTQLNPVTQPLPWGYQLAAGSAAAVVFVPASLYLAQALGTVSTNLYVSLLLSVLCIGLVPPIAITIATTLAGNWNAPGRYRAWPALVTTLLLNAVSLAVATASGVSVGVTSRIILYTLTQAVLQPAGATLAQRLLANPQEQPTVITARDPNSAATFFVPLQTASF